MAVPLANKTLFFSPPCTSSASSSSDCFKTRESITLPLRFSSYHPHSLPLRLHPCNLILGFPIPQYSPAYGVQRRRFFKFYLGAQDSIPPTNLEAEGSQNGAKSTDGILHQDQKNLTSLVALIKVYMEAVLNGDEKSVSDIEARICIAASEKNELVKKVSALSSEITSGKEKYIRLQADFDNFRKRSENEKLNIRFNAQGEVIESLLAMVDNFERARQQIKPETEREKKIDASYQGIYKQFVEVMRSHHVAAIATVGKPFDPSLHEAIAREESEDFKEGIIIQEFRRGFTLRGRLLRPATVKVSSGPGSKKANFAAEKSKEQTATAAGMEER